MGRGITEAFLAAGADVAICGRNEPAVDELPEGDGRRAVFFAADVRDAEQAAVGHAGPPSSDSDASTCS